MAFRLEGVGGVWICGRVCENLVSDVGMVLPRGQKVQFGAEILIDFFLFCGRLKLN